MLIQQDQVERYLRRTRWQERLFRALAYAVVLALLASLATLLMDVWLDGNVRLSKKFFTSFPSRRATEAGIKAAIFGTAYIAGLVALFAIPLGVGAAVYLEEYARKNWFSRFVELNIANLAGVPSIIYGLLGLELFVRLMRLDRSLIAGSLTLALLVLPVVIIASREAIRAVPSSIREAALALGATRWETVWHHVLPSALPGILTGTILAMSRAIGETAPLITIGALTYVAFVPDGLRSEFTVMPIQIYNWISRPQKEFFINAAAGIIVLMGFLLLINSIAVFIRMRYQRK